MFDLIFYGHLTHRYRGPPVSLRLGHARGLTVIQTVIQDPRAASLPAGECKRTRIVASLPAGECEEVAGGCEDVRFCNLCDKAARGGRFIT